MDNNDFRHITPVELRFNDFDILGHLNNSVYMQLMDLGKVKYFADVTGKVPAPKTQCPVIAHIDIDFEAPTFPGETLTVLTRTASIGTKSMILEQQVINPDTGSTKCRARVAMVNLDMATGATVEIGADDRRKISGYEGREL